MIAWARRCPFCRSQAAFDVVNRGRRPIALDLKNAAGRETLLRLVEQADALIEGFRPGVTEQLGIGPDVCHARNPRLVYGRITGYGQTGLLAQSAGHDINYISLTGALHSIRRFGEKPIPPMDLVGDYAGGAMFLALGMLAALFERTRSGRGQVVDAAMVEGGAVLMGAFFALNAAGSWSKEPGTNLLDTGAPFYDVMRHRTGSSWRSARSNLDFLPNWRGASISMSGSFGPDGPAVVAGAARAAGGIFRTRPRDAWREELEGTDCCVTAVLAWTRRRHILTTEAAESSSKSGMQSTLLRRPDSADRPRADPALPWRLGSETEPVLRDFGFAKAEIQALRDAHIIA